MKESGAVPPARSRRRDAVVNQERIIEAAIQLFAVRGFSVAVSEIAEAANVGIGTFYRAFPDRNALLEELGLRAYAHLQVILSEIEDEGQIGLVAVRRFLLASLDLGDRLVLPLQGAPPLVSTEAVVLRSRIDAQVETFLDQARTAGLVVSDVNATDVILCSALTARLRRRGDIWQRAARRHIEIFVAGLAQARPPGDRAVLQADVEGEFTQDRE